MSDYSIDECRIIAEQTEDICSKRAISELLLKLKSLDKEAIRLRTENAELLKQIGILQDCIYNLANEEDAALDQAYALMKTWERPAATEEGK